MCLACCTQIGRQPFTVAVANNNLEVVQLLLESGADIETTSSPVSAEF